MTMGTIINKESRRISIDNTFEVNSTLNIHKSVQDDGLDIENSKAVDFIELQDNNCSTLQNEEQDYWTKRIEYLKKEHQVINTILANEYEKTIEKTKKFNNISKITQERITKIKPCFDWRPKISKCYEENPHQPLLCSGLVQEFVTCVSSCNMED